MIDTFSYAMEYVGLSSRGLEDKVPEQLLEKELEPGDQLTGHL